MNRPASDDEFRSVFAMWCRRCDIEIPAGFIHECPPSFASRLLAKIRSRISSEVSS